MVSLPEQNVTKHLVLNKAYCTKYLPVHTKSTLYSYLTDHLTLISAAILRQVEIKFLKFLAGMGFIESFEV